MAIYHLIKAQTLISLKRKPTNTEKVFGELLQMRETQKEYTSKEIRTVVLTRHPKMSEAHLAKALHELKNHDYLLKKYNKYSLNIN
jgi:hypothetical protein